LAHVSVAILKAGCRLRFGDGFARSRLRRAWRLFGKLETDFPIVQFQVRGKRAASFRDKSRKEVCLARRHQFLRLFFRNRTLQNRFTYAECTFPRGSGGTLANVGVFQVVNLALLTNRTQSDGFMPGGVYLLRRAISVRTEIKFRFFVFAEFHCSFERTSHLAAESLQRSYTFFR